MSRIEFYGVQQTPRWCCRLHCNDCLFGVPGVLSKLGQPKKARHSTETPTILVKAGQFLPFVALLLHHTGAFPSPSCGAQLWESFGSHHFFMDRCSSRNPTPSISTPNRALEKDKYVHILRCRNYDFTCQNCQIVDMLLKRM